jgi:hypothetical protein
MIIGLASPAVPQEPAGPMAEIETKVSDGVLCEIRTTKVPGGVRLQPFASARVPTSGTYEFIATSHGAGGNANSSLSGTFDLQADEDLVLGNAMLSLESGASYAAHLTLVWEGGETSCIEPHPSQSGALNDHSLQPMDATCADLMEASGEDQARLIFFIAGYQAGMQQKMGTAGQPGQPGQPGRGGAGGDGGAGGHGGAGGSGSRDATVSRAFLSMPIHAILAACANRPNMRASDVVSAAQARAQ